MLAFIRNAAISAFQRQINRFFPPVAPQLQLAGFPLENGFDSYSSSGDVAEKANNPTWQDALWFAVPKSKISKSRKRMKTTRQKRIKMKDNIVIDKRTGELTLKHCLPYNWRNYLPGNAEHAP